MGIAEYRRIVDDVATRIRSGELRPGQKLGSYRELAQEYDVGVTTIRNALVVLEERGWTVGRPGKGTFVADRPPSV